MYIYKKNSINYSKPNEIIFEKSFVYCIQIQTTLGGQWSTKSML